MQKLIQSLMDNMEADLYEAKKVIKEYSGFV